MKRVGLVLVLLASMAQTAPVTDVVLQVFRAADPLTGLPFREVVLPWANFTCNQVPLAAPAVPVINVIRFDFDDPARLLRSCRVTTAGLAIISAFFAGLPTATGYVAVMRYRYVGGDTDPSNVVGPFQRSPGTVCGTNSAGRQVGALLTTGNITVCLEPK